MSITLTGTITGGAQTGFTSPTYTASADVAPDVNGKQAAITAVGGTQASVRVHTISDPFTVTYVRPKVMKSLPQPNPVSGLYGPVPVNTHKWIFRKGVIPALGVAPTPCVARLEIDVPAGSDSYDAPNIRALMSLIVGELNTNSAGSGDTLISGVM